MLNLLFRWFRHLTGRLTWRRALARAIFYPANSFVQSYDDIEAQFDDKEKKIKEEGSTYTPCTVASIGEEIRFEQVIELMDWLGGKDEEAVIFRFYEYYRHFYALHLSFNTDPVTRLSQERKLEILAACRKAAKETNAAAKHTKKILKHHFPELRGDCGECCG